MRPVIWFMVIILVLQACDKMLLGEEDALTSLDKNMTPPEQLNDGLEVSSLSAEDMDSIEIGYLVKNSHENPSSKQRSLLIARNNRLVLEAYFNGWNRNRKQDLRSASKSFTSALVGITIDKGFLSGVDEPVYGFFDEYDSFKNWDEKKAEITIRDFLRMRTGLACNDWQYSSAGHEERMYETYDWVKFILDLPVHGHPGEGFLYCTGAPVTLGALISNVSGQQVSDFARQYLFDPLGIRDYSLEFKPDGEADTGGHFHMKPRDMMKFGLLFLNNGHWQGEQIVSREWVEESTAPNGLVPIHNNIKFGYLWWTTSWTIDDREVPGYFASGNGGQLIFVVPSASMVVVFTGGRYNEGFLPGALNSMEKILTATRL